MFNLMSWLLFLDDGYFTTNINVYLSVMRILQQKHMKSLCSQPATSQEVEGLKSGSGESMKNSLLWVL